LSNKDFNPDTHIRGDDGHIYERKIVAATGIAVGFHAQPKTAMGAALEKAMTQALERAHADGVTDPGQLRTALQKAQNQVHEDSA
jgi:hypothetical protein